jgi:hypothetical protein
MRGRGGLTPVAPPACDRAHPRLVKEDCRDTEWAACPHGTKYYRRRIRSPGRSPARLTSRGPCGSPRRWLLDGVDQLVLAHLPAPLMSSRLATSLRGALLAARAAGHARVAVDGTLIRTDRCHAPGPTARADRPERRVDLWWSGEHAAHGGTVPVIAALDGGPVRPVLTHRPSGALVHAVGEPGASNTRAPGTGRGRRELGCVERDRYRALGAAGRA